MFFEGEAIKKDPARFMLSDFPGDKVSQYVNRFVFIRTESKVMDMKLPPSASVFDLRDFNNASANRIIEIDVGAEKPQKVALSKLWLSSKKRREVHGLEFAPGEGRLYKDEASGVWYANEFELPTYAKDNGVDRLGTFFEHMEYLIPDRDDRDWFVDWIAYSLQFPERRCKVTPLHVAQPHGTGRGWVVELIQALLGPQNCTKTKTPNLIKAADGGFNDFLNKSLFCCIEEFKEFASPDKQFNLMDNIRDVLTEDYLEVNVKFGSKKTQRVYTNFFFMTNHSDALVLSESDRRIYTIEGPAEVRHRSYYDKIYKWKSEKKNLAQLWTMLISRDLSKFNFTFAPLTTYKMSTIDRMVNDNQALFNQFIIENAGACMTSTTIERKLSDMADDPFGIDIGAKYLANMLRAKGFSRGSVSVRGKTHRIWVLSRRHYSNRDISENFVEYEPL